MSIISQTTQDSGSPQIDSEPRCNLRSRCYDSLESVQQRLDYVKQIPEAQFRNQKIEQTEPEIKQIYIIVGSVIVICVLSSLLMIQMYSQPQCENLIQPLATTKYNLEKLLDPIQVKYIKSYEESAVGKYFYWDLLAEEYFKMIVEQLKKVVWMEEEVIEQFFNQEFSEIDSKIIKSKVWKLRDKCNDIQVEMNMSNKQIWRYKNCFCL